MKNQVWIVLAAWLVLVSPALGQTDQTGVISGKILDTRGNAVDGAVVFAARADGSYPQQGITEADGTFRFAFLPPGAFEVRVEAPGFGPEKVEGVRVSAATVTPFELRLKPATEITEMVTVTASAPLLDTASTDLGTTLNSETTDILPYSRDATSLIKFTPGGQRNQLWGGSTDQANSYQLDGVSVTDPGFGGEFLLPNVDWIEEFQVKGLGAGAEYGNFQGGLVNIVTKSGSNTFEGSVRTNFESESLNSTNVNAFEAGEEQDQRWELNASVSGPFVKDKLYYFFSAQQVSTDTRVVDREASSPGDIEFFDTLEERTEQKLFGKITWQATSRDIFNLVLGVDDVETDNRGLNSIDEPSTATRQESPATFWNLSWQRIFSGRTFLEVKYTGYTGDDDRLPLNGDDQAVQFLFGGDRKLHRNAIYTRFRTRENNTFSLNLDHFLNTDDVEHHLKFGAEYNQGTWEERRSRNGGLTWRPVYDGFGIDPDDPTTWLDAGDPEFISSDWGGDIRLDAEVLNAAFWVQDYVKLTPRLNVNFGLRFGKWEGDLRPGFVGAGESRRKFNVLSDSALDPRFGLSWDVTGEQKWVVKAHWGRFHQSLSALFFDRAEGGNVFQDLLYFDWDDDPAAIDLDFPYEQPDPDNPYAPWLFAGDESIGQETGPVTNYKQPYVDQFVLGLERAIGERWKIGATYIRRDFKEILGLIDTELDRNFVRFEDVTVWEGDDGFGGPERTFTLPELFINIDDVRFVGGAPGLTEEDLSAYNDFYDPNFVLTNLPDAERKFDQVQFTFERRGEKVSLNGSVVWTDLQGNFFSVNGYDDPGGEGAGAFVNPNQQVNFFGNLANYAEWTGKLALTAELPAGFRFGTYVRYDTGEFYTPLFEIRYDSDQRFFAEGGEEFDFDLFFEIDREQVFQEKRGSREYDDFSTVDIHLDRPFEFDRGVALTVGLDVFNLFDTDAITSVETDANLSDDFEAVRLRQAPRTVRLSAALSW